MLLLVSAYGNPRISIVMPIYNQQKFLKCALDQIFNQTYQNFEVICVNDKSTDNSEQIIREYQETRSNLILVNNPENMGTLNARSVGVLRASGDYILQFDADDNFTSSTVLFDLSVNIQDASIYHFGETWMYNGTPITDCAGYTDRCDEHVQGWVNPRLNSTFSSQAIHQSFLKSGISPLIHGKLIKSSVFKQGVNLLGALIGVHVTFTEDYLLMFALTKFAEQYEPLQVTGYVYNIWEESVLGARKWRKFVHDQIVVFQFMYLNSDVKGMRDLKKVLEWNLATLKVSTDEKEEICRLLDEAWLKGVKMCDEIKSE
ncbi:Glycosyl_transferase family 2 protein [Hexamita inflata]|uniref:Glycosyl transferase family 2 protein n=1 Tax=Hexamita inflata TaxID=28002 RepID=A0AA86UEH8_9EUKA|nr:Glycosyl transferase family 2 protein [Hexamita inflata]